MHNSPIAAPHAAYPELHAAIREWYRHHGRQTLPWRCTRDPYHVYVSEIMLQQTQVKTVLARYYGSFLEAFPTLEALAHAPLERVLKQWEGLGYYNRARYLHATARRCAPSLPTDPEELLRLPGIGRNTAHAIAVFAHGASLPIMEANVKRLLCRVYAIASPTPKQLWAHAYGLLDCDHPYDYNQAMMDIGALVCLPKQPRCDTCPLRPLCRAASEDTPEAYPRKQAKSIPLKEAVVCFGPDTQVLLYQRQERFLHGLWGFVFATALPSDARTFGVVRHTYSHFKLRVTLYASSSPLIPTPETRLVALAALPALPLSTLDHKIRHAYEAFLTRS